MGIGYTKLTKEEINFPKYCLFFIKELEDAINKCELSYVTYTMVTVSTTYRYCSEAFDLIVKTFERKGLDVATPTFKMEMKDGVKYYNYKWKFRRFVDCGDLPF